MARQIATSPAGKDISPGGNGLRERTLGVVDIGSNTVHMLVARTNGRTVIPLVDLSEGLRLGGDVDTVGAIGEQKQAELLRTLRGFKEIATDAGAHSLHLLATHAIRIATNRHEVCQAITEATGLDVEVLAPELEAAIAFRGADADCPSVGPQVMVDIGGGSMQIAVGHHGQVWDSVSLPLGTSRVVTHFLPSDPPTYVEEAQFVSYLAQVVPSALPLPDSNVTGIIGVGGTLRRVPQMLGMKTRQDLPVQAIERIIGGLRGLTAEEAAAQYGLKPDRARLLFPAMLLIREVMRGYDFPPLIMSAYGIREGAILYLASGGDKKLA